MSVRCANCGYDWAGLPLVDGELICPECGVKGPPQPPPIDQALLYSRAFAIGSWPTVGLPAASIAVAVFTLEFVDWPTYTLLLGGLASVVVMPIVVMIYKIKAHHLPARDSAKVAMSCFVINVIVIVVFVWIFLPTI
jgi:hypothetical protein